MIEQPKPKLREIVLRFENSPDVTICAWDIEHMMKAAEALEMLQHAKQIAERLSKL